ncbi:MAG: 2-hydroxychromene-2-carboxylate isomerase [Pseudomonadota bacterium]
MTKEIEFIFDFGSPNAYLAHHGLKGIVERTGASVRYVPCLLGGIFKATNNTPPMMAFSDVKGKLDYEQKDMHRFLKAWGLNKFTFNPHFPVNTLILVRGAVAAQADGTFDAYLDAGLRHMWEDGLKMDDPEVFVEAMTKAGLDGKGLLERTQDSAIKAKLMENTNSAIERGVFGIPTFFVGGEMFFGKDRLNHVEDAVAA